MLYCIFAFYQYRNKVDWTSDDVIKSLLRGAPRPGLALGPASARAGPGYCTSAEERTLDYIALHCPIHSSSMECRAWWFQMTTQSSHCMAHALRCTVVQPATGSTEFAHTMNKATYVQVRLALIFNAISCGLLSVATYNRINTVSKYRHYAESMQWRT